LSIRLSKIDELILANQEHYYLDSDDECFYIGEYTARQGYAFSETNNLIHNLKKSPKLRGTSQWKWKEHAIRQAGHLLRTTLVNKSNEEWLKASTLVPIPPSKIEGDPEYDDRMYRILQELGEGLELDIRELVRQRKSTPAAHERTDRPSPTEVAENYYIVEELSVPVPAQFGVFDDLLTAGSHFKAMKMVLRDRFPNVPVGGIFIARRVLEATE
jgi:predicted amidophosphoribosyltransferase